MPHTPALPATQGACNIETYADVETRGKTSTMMYTRKACRDQIYRKHEPTKIVAPKNVLRNFSEYTLNPHISLRDINQSVPLDVAERTPLVRLNLGMCTQT